MTLNIDLEDVPFAILETVKARIMANRRRLQQGQQQPRRSTRPRPQFAKIGASSRTWRLPEDAAIVLDDKKNIGHFWWFNPQVTLSQPTEIFAIGGFYPGVSKNTFSSVESIKAIFASGKAVSSRSFQYGKSILGSLPAAQITISKSAVPKSYSGTVYTRSAPSNPYSISIYDGASGSCSQNQQLQDFVNNGFPPTSTDVFQGSLVELLADASFPSIVKIYYNYTQDFVVLPCGGGAFILLVCASYNYEIITGKAISDKFDLTSAENADGSYDSWLSNINNVNSGTAILPVRGLTQLSKADGSDTLNKAYICTDSSIREIFIPAAVNALIEQINPRYQPASRSYAYTEAQYSPVTIERRACPTNPFEAVTYTAWSYQSKGSTFTQPQLRRTTASLGSGSKGFMGQDTHTPAIFKDINDLINFTSPNLIKDFPQQERWLLRDESSSEPGIYRYKQWPVPGQEPNSNQGINLPEASFSIGDSIDPSLPDLNDPNSGSSLHHVWDWGDPAYCRQMCLELGFSASDLQP